MIVLLEGRGMYERKQVMLSQRLLKCYTCQEKFDAPAG